MKVLYVKINSERARKFQLKTIVYEKDGQKFVTKQAMHCDAIPHLKKMKENYSKLTDSIINPRIKLAKIIDEKDDSLTFEFIEGISLQTQVNLAKKQNKQALDRLIENYKNLIQTGFKTTSFDTKNMVTQSFKDLLGDFDYASFDGKQCFDGISNIDLIFSNIIYKDDDIYLIDYEWVYDFNIPVEFSLFRALHEDNDLHWMMEKHFVFQEVVGQHGFLQIANNYTNKRTTLDEQEKYIQDLYVAIEDKDVHIKSQETIMEKAIHDKDIHIKNQEITMKKIIHDKDVYIKDQETHINDLNAQIQELFVLVESMRLKNRLKRVIKRVIPAPLWALLKKIKNKIHPPVLIAPETTANHPVNNYVYLEPSFSEDIQKEIDTFENTPLISIIMPVYNVAPKWLNLAIESIKSQWYSNWELCMIDDKSTDEETLAYLRNIDNPKIKVKFLEENLNISGASNAALELTSGEYIALMDNDDELTPDALYEVVKAINTGAYNLPHITRLCCKNYQIEYSRQGDKSTKKVSDGVKFFTVLHSYP